MFRSSQWTLRIAILALAFLAWAAVPVYAQRGRGGASRGGVSYAGVSRGGYYGGYYRGGIYGGYYPRGYYFGGFGYPYYGYPYAYAWNYPYYYSGGVVNTVPSASYYYAPPYAPSYPYVPSGVEVISPAADTEASATVDVLVPADAQVWFDDVATKQTGGSRAFASPPLPIGQTFYYSVHARWTDNGRVIDQTRRIEVHPSQTTVVDFTKP